MYFSLKQFTTLFLQYFHIRELRFISVEEVLTPKISSLLLLSVSILANTVVMESSTKFPSEESSLVHIMYERAGEFLC